MEIALKMKNEEMKKQRKEERVRMETLQRLREREEAVDRTERTKLEAMRHFEAERERISEKRK